MEIVNLPSHRYDWWYPRKKYESGSLVEGEIKWKNSSDPQWDQEAEVNMENGAYYTVHYHHWSFQSYEFNGKRFFTENGMLRAVEDYDLEDVQYKYIHEKDVLYVIWYRIEKGLFPNPLRW